MIPFIQYLTKAKPEQQRTDQDFQQLARKEDLTNRRCMREILGVTGQLSILPVAVVKQVYFSKSWDYTPQKVNITVCKYRIKFF